MSGFSGCCVPETQGYPVGNVLRGNAEFCGSTQLDGSLPQSAALPGTARGCDMSSSVAFHLYFSNSRNLHYYFHLIAGEE